MSGLEVLAAVTSIISAFNGSMNIYLSWRDRRSDRAEDEYNQQLERSLAWGSTTIQQEYDTHFARLGPGFSSGDDTAKAQLAHYLAQLQSTIATLRSETRHSNTLHLPSFYTLLAASEDTRNGVVAALADQYQRMAQAGPISRTFRSSVHRHAIRGSVASETQRPVSRIIVRERRPDQY